MMPLSQSLDHAARLRRSERRRELEVLVLEVMADLISGPIKPLLLDRSAERLVAAFLDLNIIQQRALRARLGEVRLLNRSPTRGRP